MAQTPNDPSADAVLSLRLPPGTDPAIASSLKRGLEELLTVVMALPGFETRILQCADAIALAFTGLVAPAAPLIEERIRRQKAMHEVFARGDWLTAEQVNGLQVMPPANKEQPAGDWKRQGRIFSVTFEGNEYFAGYQFDAMCQPLPVVRDILAILGPVADSWRIAAWFHFPNGWIAGHGDRQGDAVAPRDALDRRREVIEAARHTNDDYVA
ncbi:hypothetical protein WK66_29270 [Burkholderia ubonensis]|uniref:hypothetical protein n=1 Tax=Burkholderia ubonensis TaxID=101571 RepID=UPI000753D056|nr:hypothetical protein [Burkholderia ubonensis]KVU36789.1 hypothetical protein WK66_29270 [Burkholderia ubonensis]